MLQFFTGFRDQRHEKEQCSPNSFMNVTLRLEIGVSFTAKLDNFCKVQALQSLREKREGKAAPKASYYSFINASGENVARRENV